MQDALLNRSLRLTIVGTISTLALICLILGYQALFDAICGNLPDAASKMTWALGAGISAILLIRYRCDLIDT